MPNLALLMARTVRGGCPKARAVSLNAIQMVSNAFFHFLAMQSDLAFPENREILRIAPPKVFIDTPVSNQITKHVVLISKIQ